MRTGDPAGGDGAEYVAVRRIVAGRAHRAAAVMSLLETARLNGVEPYGWLKQVLERLPEWSQERLHELLPFAKNPLNN